MEYWGFDAMCEVFVLLTRCAAFDVFCDPSPSTGPEVFSIDAPNGFILSRVAVNRSFMPYVHQFSFQTLIWGNYELSSFSVSSEWFVWIVYPFNWVCPFPFIHQGMAMVLDDCDHVLD
jgi:hypothetical protein